MCIAFLGTFARDAVDWFGCFFASRRHQWVSIACAVPSVVVGSLVIAVTVLKPDNAGGLIEVLSAKAVVALESEDFKQVDFLLERIRETGRTPTNLEYQLALAYEKKGDVDATRQIMERLASELVVERPDALKWLGLKILDKPQLSQADLTQAAKYFDDAIKQYPGDAQSHWFLAQCQLRLGLSEEAAEHLSLLTPYDYRAGLLLAEVCRKLDRPQEAALAVEKSLALVAVMPPEKQSVLTARAHGECLFFLRRDKEAMEVFKAALDQYQDDSLKVPLLVTYLRLLGESKDELEKVNLLNAALELAPRSPYLLGQVSQLSMQKGDSAPIAENILEEALRQGQSTPALNFVLGTNASERGDTDKAVAHLRDALEKSAQAMAMRQSRSLFTIDPKSAEARDVEERKLQISHCMIQNNLAWTLMMQEQPDLDEALALANEVCEKFPAVHSFRETRGQILIRQGQWQAALQDLTYALEGMPKYVILHQSLAKAYQATGNKIAAQRHERLASQYAAEDRAR